jgi:hypothetical protein
MAIDFYFRNEDDPNYQPNIYEVKDDIENTIQQVRMTVLTKKGEVLGEPDFGFGMEKYLFEFDTISIVPMEQEVNQLIQDYVLNSRKYNVKSTVSYLDSAEDPYKSTLALDIKIDGSQSVFAALFDV